MWVYRGVVDEQTSDRSIEQSVRFGGIRIAGESTRQHCSDGTNTLSEPRQRPETDQM